jgi:uncharacterized membrane protein (UPF0127 family)
MIGGYFLVKNAIHQKQVGAQICADNICFSVQVARTPKEQQQGLMYRTSMDPKEGMLFVFAQMNIHTFRMKNTMIPLDILWLDDQRKIVHIVTAQPCDQDPCPVYMPEHMAKYVVELNAGNAKTYHLQTGMYLQPKNIQDR